MPAPLEEQSRYSPAEPVRQEARIRDGDEAVRDRVRHQGRTGDLAEPRADPADAGDELAPADTPPTMTPR